MGQFFLELLVVHFGYVQVMNQVVSVLFHLQYACGLLVELSLELVICTGCRLKGIDGIGELPLHRSHRLLHVGNDR